MDHLKLPSTGTIRRLLSFSALTIGLGFTVWLIVASSLAAVLDNVAAIGWGIAAIVAVRAAMIAINAAAWRQVLTSFITIPFAVLVLLRWIREAIDLLLPVASIGGSLVGARLMTFWRVPGVMALAGVFADVLLQTVAQAVFALAGVLTLGAMIGFHPLIPVLLFGLIGTALALGGFYLLQRYGAAWLIDRLWDTVASSAAPSGDNGATGFQTAMERIWRGRARYLLAALVTHTAAWTLGTLEVWFALRFMGWPVTVTEAVVLESLGVSISTAAFFIPGSWGVQEGGFVLIGQLLGMPADLALTLSLVKRIPDLALGVPGLVLWRAVEARRLLVKRPVA
jgi:putative membrane protein